MKRRSLLRRKFYAMVAIGGSLSLHAQLDPSARRGKVIYLEGRSPTGAEITAVIGEGGTEVPASVMPCGSCHGADGRGRPEGGVAPSDLTWPALTKPYGLDHPSGRQHPPYDSRSLVRAVTMGIDPAGNALHIAMPRYRLSHQDAADLVAYLRQLEADVDPGLDATSITLATQLPRSGELASLGAAMEGVLRAYFEDLNERGGLYSRRVELRVIETPAPAAERVATLRRELERGEIFALVGSFLPGAESETAALLDELEVPLIGPFTQHPQVDWPLNPFVFYLLPGLEDQGRALAAHADSADSAAVVIAEEALFEPAAAAIVERRTELGFPGTRQLRLPELETLEERPEQVFLLATGRHQSEFFEHAAAIGWFPRVLLPGSLLASSTFAAAAGFDQRIVLAFPTLPSNQSHASAREFRQLAERHRLPSRHIPAQIAALAAARVLVEGLERAGRELSRRRLIEALEGLHQFDNGLTPLVSFGPNRRVGVTGAYLLALDLEHRRLLSPSGWIASR